ncbi:hypothetical protein C882_0020 [Caenispirillum salinarum AK4]|uniref:Uncharacterized protein n=2 Tax=Caenispirillum TaxID=414051 RepID=K9H5R8_9PROT|nr:hypothetical protein C882_0020 [Caenispirillum salinarum AK4]
MASLGRRFLFTGVTAMTLLRSTLLALSGLAFAAGLGTSASASDVAVPQAPRMVTDVRTSWSPGYVNDGGQYVRLRIVAAGDTDMRPRLMREDQTTWAPGFQHDGDGHYVRETLGTAPVQTARVAHFEDHYTPGAMRDDGRSWIRID